MPTPNQSLASVPTGTVAIVQEIRVAPTDRVRLMELGLLVGTPVKIVRFAPLGGPVEIKLRGYHLSLRKQEAEQIWVSSQ